MADFHAAIAQYKDLSEEAQKKAGQATGTDMESEHKQFLKDLIAMLDRKEIDLLIPSSFLRQEMYGTLQQEAKDTVDLALLNLCDQIRLIEQYFRSSQTPDASPQLQTMIVHLWDMKSRLEDKYGDVLKF